MPSRMVGCIFDNIVSTMLQGFPYELPLAASRNPRRLRDLRGPNPHTDELGIEPVSLVRRREVAPCSVPILHDVTWFLQNKKGSIAKGAV